MKDRLYNALGNVVVQQYGIPKPENPFKSPLVKSNSSSSHQSPLHTRSSFFSPPKTNQPLFGSPTSTVPTSYSHPVNPSILQSANQQQQNISQIGYGQTTPNPNIYTPQSTQQQTFANPMSTSFPQMSGSSVPVPQMLPATSNTPQNFYSPVNQQAYQQNTNESYLEPRKTSYQETKPATAWNDPPMVQPKIKVFVCFFKY
jgi:hypothetical protein